MNHKFISCPDCKGHGYISGGDERSTWSRYCERCHGTGYVMVPKTRADRIRELSDKELADIIYELNMETTFCTSRKECGELLNLGKLTDEMCKKCLVEWLQQPVEEPKMPAFFEEKQESGLLED